MINIDCAVDQARPLLASYVPLLPPASPTPSVCATLLSVSAERPARGSWSWSTFTTLQSPESPSSAPAPVRRNFHLQVQDVRWPLGNQTSRQRFTNHLSIAKLVCPISLSLLFEVESYWRKEVTCNSQTPLFRTLIHLQANLALHLPPHVSIPLNLRLLFSTTYLTTIYIPLRSTAVSRQHEIGPNTV